MTDRITHMNIRPLGSLSEKDKERFWAKVNKSGPIHPGRPELGNCWVWMGSKNNKGYGQFFLNFHCRKTHRVSFYIAGNPEAEWSLVCHSCDNPPCCNPSHLFSGTHLDNVRDMITKGRLNPSRGDTHFSRTRPDALARGVRNGRAVLTEHDVSSIRELSAMRVSLGKLAKRFNVGKSTIKRVIERINWAHI